MAYYESSYIKPCIGATIRDRPFNLKGGGLGFFFWSEYFFRDNFFSENFFGASRKIDYLFFQLVATKFFFQK